MDSHFSRNRLWSLPSNVVRVVAHILNPSEAKRKPARITVNGDELRARRDTRPNGHVERRG